MSMAEKPTLHPPSWLRLSSVLAALLLFADACVDPISIGEPTSENQLVVDGFVSDEPGPYTVKLYRAKGLGFDTDYLVAVTKARVWIIDDLDNAEELTEPTRGIYQTSSTGMRGVIGREYRVKIRTFEGEEYTSNPQKLEAAGVIDSLYYEFETNNVLVKGVLEQRPGFAFYMDGTGARSEDNRQRWKWTGTYEVLTFPHLKTRRDQNGVIVPDPRPCSGYVVSPTGALTQVDVCECCTCWVNDFNQKPIVANDQFFEGGQFERVSLGFVPINEKTFYTKYHFEVMQLSLSREAYDFWNLIRIQIEGTKDLFLPPTAKIQGNIISLNGAPEALGFFSVSAVARRSVEIGRYEVPIHVPELDTVAESCRFYENSTNIKPPYW